MSTDPIAARGDSSETVINGTAGAHREAEADLGSETGARSRFARWRSAATNWSRAYRLPILSGLLIGTSYIPFPPWALFFCLAPLFLFWMEAPTARRAFWGGWTTQFILNAIGFHWIAYTAVAFGGFPWPAGLGVLLFFCAFAHLYFAFTGWLWAHARDRLNLKPEAGLFAMAALLLFMDHLFPKIFPWHLGYPWLWAGFPGSQNADLIGFDGLYALTVFTNAALAWAWCRRKRAPRAAALAAGACAVFLVAFNLVGGERKKAWDAFDAEANFLVVQGNIGNFEKIMAEQGRGFQDHIVKKYIDLTRQGLERHPDTDVVLWPETAFPDYLDTQYLNDRYPQQLRAYVTTARKPLLTGAYSHDAGTKQTYNGFFLMAPDGSTPLTPYRKTILLAFGEYMPGASLLPAKLIDALGVSQFGRGSGPITMAWQNLKIGPQVCYEGLYPYFSAGLAQSGAEILTNVTNDSWFGTYFEPYQHLYMTFARALEFRRPLVRATNTGITTAILANGEILRKSPLHREWAGQFKVRYRANPPHTVYQKILPFWPYLLAFLTALLLVSARGKPQSD